MALEFLKMFYFLQSYCPGLILCGALKCHRQYTGHTLSVYLNQGNIPHSKTNNCTLRLLKFLGLRFHTKYYSQLSLTLVGRSLTTTLPVPMLIMSPVLSQLGGIKLRILRLSSLHFFILVSMRILYECRIHKG